MFYGSNVENYAFRILLNFRNLVDSGKWGDIFASYLEPLNAATRNNLMEIMEDRYEQSGIVIISQLPTEQ